MSITTLNPTFSAMTHYLDQYRCVEKTLPGNELLQSLRKTALTRFSSLGFPTRKHADWKYTPLNAFLQTPFFINALDNASEELDTLEPSDSPYRLVFLNGHFSASLSKLNTLSNELIIGDLATQLKTNAESLVNYFKTSAEEKNPFIQLNTAFIQDGAYIYVPPNLELTAPIELVFINHGEQSFIPVRNVIIAEENSRAVIIEKHISLNKEATSYFSNTMTECFLAAKSQLAHYKLIEESEKSTHIGNLCATQQIESQFFSYSIALNGGVVRSDTKVKLCQPQAQCHLKGLYHAQGKQHISHQTVIDHISPDTRSQEFYKGIIGDKANAAFNGKVIVRPQAIKSKAEQLNKNLLLSREAEVNTQPQLEIFVDDVQCTHGASIGQLDENALFYLRARGLNAQDARNVLIKAFIQDIIQQMPLLTSHAALSYSLKSLLASSYETA